MYVNWKFDLQEFLILPPLDFAIELYVISCSTYRSLETNRRFDPAGLANPSLDEQTRFQGAAFQDASTMRGKLLACFKVINFDLFKEFIKNDYFEKDMREY